VIFSTQVPDMLKNTPKHVKVLYQPNLESTQNQPRFLRLKFWALVTAGHISVNLVQSDHNCDTL
jgi:hypothetical protein